MKRAQIIVFGMLIQATADLCACAPGAYAQPHAVVQPDVAGVIARAPLLRDLVYVYNGLTDQIAILNDPQSNSSFPLTEGDELTILAAPGCLKGTQVSVGQPFGSDQTIGKMIGKPLTTGSAGALKLGVVPGGCRGEMTIEIYHSGNAILTAFQQINGLPFDLWNHGNDLNGLPEDPVFYGQIAACKQFQTSPPPSLSDCLTTSLPTAEDFDTCKGFPLRSMASPSIMGLNGSQIINLAIVHLAKDWWAKTHAGQDLDCTYYSCKATELTDDNVEDCVKCLGGSIPICYGGGVLRVPGVTQNGDNSHNVTLNGVTQTLYDHDLFWDLIQLEQWRSSDVVYYPADPTHVYGPMAPDRTTSTQLAALPRATQLAKVLPILYKWHQIIDDRWHFRDFEVPSTCASTSTISGSDLSRSCSLGHFMPLADKESGAGGGVTSFAGHVDLGTATYYGKLLFENHSDPVSRFGDDDINWKLTTLNGEGSIGRNPIPEGLHVEHALYTSCGRFREARVSLGLRDDFWSGMQVAADMDAAARTDFETKSPALPRRKLSQDAKLIDYLKARRGLYEKFPSSEHCIVFDDSGFDYDNQHEDQPCDTVGMPGTSEAIVIGELGLDCYHDCAPELHPAYAIMLRTRPASGSVFRGSWEDWAFFVRTDGDSGLCGTDSGDPPVSSLSRQAAFKGQDRIRFYVPSENVELGGVDVVAHSAGGPVVANATVSIQAVPGAGTIVSVALRSGSIEYDWVEGEFSLGRPGFLHLFPRQRISRLEQRFQQIKVTPSKGRGEGRRKIPLLKIAPTSNLHP